MGGEEPRCLVRARSNKKKSKITTIVYAKDCVRFQLAIGNIMQQHMDGLKKREKRKGEKVEKAPKKVKKDGATKKTKKPAEPSEKPAESQAATTPSAPASSPKSKP